MDVFSYLSVLVSIVVGLGMSHLLQATVRIIQNRATMTVYLPSALWAVTLFLIFALVWWSDFNLVRHQGWTFAQFLGAVGVPAVLYIVSGLVLPAGESSASYDMRENYFMNRRWLFSLTALAISMTFAQTYLLDRHIPLDLDTELKLMFLLATLVPAFVENERVQYIIAGLNLTWLLVYVTILFANLRTSG